MVVVALCLGLGLGASVDTQCLDWGADGHCEMNEKFMLAKCPGLCESRREAMEAEEEGDVEDDLGACTAGCWPGVDGHVLPIDIVVGLGPETERAVSAHRKANIPLLIKLRVEDWAHPSLKELTTARTWFGHKTVQLARSSELTFNGGNGYGEHVSLDDFIDRAIFREELPKNTEPPYVFKREMFNETELRRLFPGLRAGGPKASEPRHELRNGEGENVSPAALQELKWGDHIAMLGGAGSGSAIHEHDESVSGLLFGQKRWVLWENSNTPWGGSPSDHYIGEWFRRIGPQEPPGRRYDFVQTPGDLIYVPDGYYHGVLNTELSFSIAFQRAQMRESTEAHSIKRRVRKASAKEKERLLTEAFGTGCLEAGHLLGMLVKDDGRLGEGINLQRQVVAQDPSYLTAHAVLGDFLSAAGSAKEALDHLNRIMADGSVSGNFSMNLRTTKMKLLTKYPEVAGSSKEARSLIVADIEHTKQFASQDYVASTTHQSALFVEFYTAGSSAEWLYFSPRTTRPGLDALVMLFTKAGERRTALERAATKTMKWLRPFAKLKAGRVLTPVRVLDDAYGLSWAKDDFSHTRADYPFVALLIFGEDLQSDRKLVHRGGSSGVKDFIISGLGL